MADSRRFPPPRAHSPRFPSAPSVSGEDPVASAVDYLAEIEDVTITSPSNRDALLWDDASGSWINSPIAQADVTDLVSDLALKAPLASPALTGVPTAPTATPLTGTTQVATTEYADDAADAAAAALLPIDTSDVTGLDAALATIPSLPIDTSDVTGLDTALGTIPADLNDLDDVNAGSPTDQDVLTWDDGTSRWIPQVASGGVSALDDIGDVNAPSPSDLDVLTWDDGASEWVAQAPASGGSVDWADVTGKPSTFTPTLPIAESDVTSLVSDLAAKAPLASPAFTGTPNAAGTLRAGRTMLQVLDIPVAGTPTNGTRIVTAIPYGATNGMFSLHFRGYTLDTTVGQVDDFTIGFYNHSTGLLRPSLTTAGSFVPLVTIGNVGGYVAIFLLDKRYYRNMTLGAAYHSYVDPDPAMFEGWAVTDEDTTGASDLTVLTPANAFGAVSATYVATGSTPATGGGVRMSNNEVMYSRNAANSANVVLTYLSSSNNQVIGGSGNSYVLYGSTNGHRFFDPTFAYEWARIFPTYARFGYDTLASTMALYVNAAAGQEKWLSFQSAAVNRFILRVTGAESGSNAGANLELLARQDDGSAIDSPIGITRASGGAMTIRRPLTLTAGLASGAIASGVTGVTQSPGDDSTKLATTAYVDAAAGGGGGDPDTGIGFGRHAGTTDLEVWYPAGFGGSDLYPYINIYANQLYAFPFIAPARGGTIDQVMVLNNSAQSGLELNVGIYDSKSDTNIFPDTLLDSATLIMTSTGRVASALDGGSLALTGGKLYWFVFHRESTGYVYGSSSVNFYNSANPLGVVVGATGITSVLGLSMYRLFTSGLPSTFPAYSVASQTQVPYGLMRFSA